MDKTFQKIIILLFIAIGLFLSAEVKADTFGNTGAGATSSSMSPNYLTLSKGTPVDGDGSVSKFSVSVLNTKAYTIALKGVIYTYTSAYQVITNSVTPAGTIPVSVEKHWIDISYSTSPSVTNNTNYYLANISNNNWNTYYDTGSAGDGGFSNGTNSYTTPTSFTTIRSGATTNKYSIYATYTPSGGEERRIIITQ